MNKKNVPAPYGALPNARQYEHFVKFSKKAFFHFGPNTFTNAEWGNGTEVEDIVNPTDCDIRSWVKTAKDAGFTLAILVAKHHDGFCMWQTDSTPHSIKNSPYKNGKGDFVREFTDACHEMGIAAGVYISPWDRNSVHWGKPEYNDVYATQLTELMTKYGKINEVWWDGAGSAEAKYDWDRWVKIIRDNQPDAAIFGSMGAAPYIDFRWVGNEAGFAGEVHYASVDQKSVFVENNEEINTGKLGGDSYIPAEVDTSIRPGWFYHADQDNKVKSPETLNKLWFRSVGRNAYMLLNFPPDRRGRICDTDRENAIEANRRIREMLLYNFMDGATVEADSTYSEDCLPAYAVDGNPDTFYAASEKKAVLHFHLKERVLANVLTLGEEIRLGERICRVHAEDGEGHVLFDGESVGYSRAYMFEERELSEVVLTVVGADVPTLRCVGLHFFGFSLVDPATKRDVNLMDNSSATVEMAPDRMSAVLTFGGIYSFRRVECRVGGICGVTVEAFDGFKFNKLCKVLATSSEFEWFFDEEIEGSYKIRISAERPFLDDPKFFVG